MAMEIITPHFECVAELKRLIKALGDHHKLNTSDGPKYMYFTTQVGTDVRIDQDNLELEGVCTQICGHMLTLAEMGTPLIEAAKMCFLQGTLGTSISVTQSWTHPDSRRVHTIEISEGRNKLIFKELGASDDRYCDLTFIRV